MWSQDNAVCLQFLALFGMLCEFEGKIIRRSLLEIRLVHKSEFPIPWICHRYLMNIIHIDKDLKDQERLWEWHPELWRAEFCRAMSLVRVKTWLHNYLEGRHGALVSSDRSSLRYSAPLLVQAPTFWNFEHLCQYKKFFSFLRFECRLVYLSFSDWCLLLLIDADWCWLMLSDAQIRFN